MNSIKAQLDNVIDIFDMIGESSSNNDKIQLIQKYCENELFLDILKFVYDDYITSGISSKSLSNFNKIDIELAEQGNFTLRGLMEYVSANNTGSFSVIATIQTFMSPFSDKEREFLTLVFSKELKVGITAKTINKALGRGFIREFNVQLAHPFHKHPEKVTGKRFVLTQKLDGHRCICIVKEGRVTFYTRKGLIINGLSQQADDVLDLVEYGMNSDTYVLDGELVLENSDGLATKDLFRATSRILRSDTADKSRILYNIFDALPLSEFLSGESALPFEDRKYILTHAFINDYGPDLDYSFTHLRLVKNLYVGNDLTAIKKLQEKYVHPLGWEGLMINLADGKYQTKRTTNLLKVKEFYDADVRVKDIFEGTGKLTGELGGVIVDYKGYDIRVGSGFTEEDRIRYWQHPDQILDHIVDVSYFEETHNQNNDNISLRFPTFVAVRNDKDTVSYEV